MNYIERNIKRKAYFSDDVKAFEGGLNPQEYYETPTNNINNMKKYKLLRDLPGYKAGTIFINHGNERLVPYSYKDSDYPYQIHPRMISCSNGWFECVQDIKFTENDMKRFAVYFNRLDKHDVSVAEDNIDYWLSSWIQNSNRL